jgi:hypothetical protein
VGWIEAVAQIQSNDLLFTPVERHQPQNGGLL